MTATPAPTIDALPTAPSRSDSDAVFVSRADAFVAALPVFRTQLNAAGVAAQANAEATATDAAATAADRIAVETAAGAAVNVAGYVATSASSLAVSAGAKAVTLVESGRLFADGDDVTLISRADNRVRMRGVASSCDMVAKTMTVTVAAGGFSGSGTVGGWIVAQSAFVNLPGGKQALPIMAPAIKPRVTSGPYSGRAELSTNKIVLDTLDFDASAAEYAQFMMVMPKAWNEGTVSFQPVWSHGSGASAYKVSWGLRAVAISDGDALDAAMGTAQYSNDTGGTANTQYTGPESAAITIGGTPQAGDLVVFEIFRAATDATNDTLDVDAKLLGFVLFFTTDAGDDA